MTARFQLSAFVFVLASLLMLAAVHGDEALFAFVGVLFVLSGTVVTGLTVNRLYAYTGLLLGFHIAMTGFVTWVFLNRENVEEQKMFVFTTFTPENLRMAVTVLVVACLAVLSPLLVSLRGRKSVMRASANTLVWEIIGNLPWVRLIWTQLALCASLAMGLYLFLANPSVIDISYPFQVREQWASWTLLKLPTLLSASVLVVTLARHLQGAPGFGKLLPFAKANFLLVAILMLLLTGSRGLFTFLWLGFGALELMLWYKRRGSLPWAFVFLALSWFAFRSWPFMRASLAHLPADEVLWKALQIGFGMPEGGELPYVGPDKIRLSEFTMIGASLFHLLYVIELVRDGITLAGATFLNLLPQALPSWLDGVLWERPQNDNWRLAEYYYHGGGFLMVANTYWNGGLWVAALFIAVLSRLFMVFDHYMMNRNAGFVFRIVYWLWAPVAVVQLGYGIQGLVRVVEILLLTMLVDYLLRRRKRRGVHAMPAPLRYPGAESRGGNPR